MRFKKIVLLIILIILPIFILTGCASDNYSIEDMAYVIAIGIDKGESNLLKVSLQFATPSSSLNGESTRF